MLLDEATGEMVEKALSHERKEEVRAFYAGLGRWPRGACPKVRYRAMLPAAYLGWRRGGIR